jgi:DegV family protein with EDD domain
MASVGILTDTSVQFSRPSFPGSELITLIPLRVQLGQQIYGDGRELKVSSLPSSARHSLQPRLVPPSVEELQRIFLAMGQTYSEIVAIFISSALHPVASLAHKAAASVRGRTSVQIIDSQTISIGLGVLVQTAAEAAARGARAIEIERLLRGLIPHIYTVFCIPGLSYLYQAGFLGQAQGIVGEMLNLLPIFTLEDGVLTSLEKARNLRHLTDFFQEFLDEFTDLYHIAVVQSVPPLPHEARMLREHSAENFPGTPFSEHPIGLPMATLFGPHTFGLFALELPSDH